MKPGTLSGYQHDKAIGYFHDRDDLNRRGFEMRMTSTEYNALNQFITKLYKDAYEQGREEVANQVRAALTR